MGLFQKKLGPLGIDVSDGSIEVAQVRLSSSGPAAVHGYGRAVLEPGVIKEGRLLKPQDFVLTLRKLLAAPKFGKLDGKQLVFAVPEHQCYHYTFVLDAIGDTRLPYNAVKEQLAATMPRDVEGVMWDWMQLRKQGSKTYVYALAIPKDVIEAYQQAFASIGIVMRAAEAQVLSSSRGMWASPFVDEPLLHLDLGAYESSASTVDDLGVHQSSVIDVGMETVVADLVQELQLNADTARKIVLSIGLRNLKHPQVVKIHAVVKRYLQRVYEEAQQHLTYYHTQEHVKPATISRMYLVGGGSLIPGAQEALSQSLKLSVELEPLRERYKPVLSPQDFALYANALGAARRSLDEHDKDINVLMTKRLLDAAEAGFFAKLFRRMRGRRAGAP